MRVVIADTGSLNYLVLIDQAHVLAALFGSVLIPEAVRRELTQPGAPAAVRAWMAAPPTWLSIQPDTGGTDTALQRLGAGEREAVLVAIALQADLILMDDRAGVAAARAKGFTVVGTLGLIDRAAHHRRLDLLQALARLQATNFRCRPDMLHALIARHRNP